MSSADHARRVVAAAETLLKALQEDSGGGPLRLIYLKTPAGPVAVEVALRSDLAADLLQWHKATRAELEMPRGDC